MISDELVGVLRLFGLEEGAYEIFRFEVGLSRYPYFVSCHGGRYFTTGLI
jgi:hypothetical protein